MKKIIPFVIIVLIVVIGVIIFLVLNNSKDSSELEESIGKAQLVEVYDYDTNELLKTYGNKEDIESLINNLGLDKWKLDKAPNDDTKKYLLLHSASILNHIKYQTTDLKSLQLR